MTVPQDKADHPTDTSSRGSDLFQLVYSRLKAMAGRTLEKSSDDSLNTTALVHELYIKLSQAGDLKFGDQNQFFDYAAKSMRHILIDRARAKIRIKRGGGDLIKVELESDTTSMGDITAERAIEVDSALKDLEAESPRAAKIVELHFFAGIPIEKIAVVLGVSARTVSREWRFARAYLHSRN